MPALEIVLDRGTRGKCDAKPGAGGSQGQQQILEFLGAGKDDRRRAAFGKPFVPELRNAAAAEIAANPCQRAQRPIQIITGGNVGMPAREMLTTSTMTIMFGPRP